MLLILTAMTTFVLTNAAYLAGGWIAIRRMLRRMTPQGLAALKDAFEHVLLPVRAAAEPSDSK